MSQNMTFIVSLNNASSNTVTVDYQTVDGTATSPSDYESASGTLTFAPGETEKTIVVVCRDDIPGSPEERFTVQLSNPTNGAILRGTGTGILPGETVVTAYLERFNTLYENIHDQENGYFGPQSGSKAFSIPRHIPEIDSRIINEAPDYGGQTVSETASFWVGLEAWNGALNGNWSGYNNAWNKIDQYFVPDATNQPMATYDANSPADYTPEATSPDLYPRLADPNAPVGSDPLAGELESSYGNKRMYLMHWIIDVEGAYGFHNADNSTTNVFINTYERGMQESSFETVTHPCWADWNNGGSQYGYEPLFVQGTQWYPQAPYDWGKKFSYTNAPDAEVRAIQWSYRANQFATEQGSQATINSSTTKARKMGDYLRYNLFDKYFRQIGNSSNAGSGYNSCHYLINWYSAWGGGIPESGQTSDWGYRIGGSESHHGYQGVNIAYYMAQGGGGMTPVSPSAGTIWKSALYRQIEMIRWLQSPEGPIAGGVTNSWLAQYLTPTDGRQSAKFYGMYYTYSPVWHDPPSNNWVGFQAWGHGRTADLLLEVADKDTELAVEIRPNLEIILDKLVKWFLDESELLGDGTFLLPSTLSWVSETQVVGQTTTEANLEGVYEYLPTLSWNGDGDYGAFWNQSTVPNPNLHCTVVEKGIDLGVAASLASMLISYAQAKRLMNKFTTTIPNSSYTAEDAFELARELLDRIWSKYYDGQGIAIPEPRGDYDRMGDPVYIPSNFSGTMPNGDQINQSSTFISLRSFLEDDPKWSEVQAYIENPSTAPVPVFTYHRFWAQAEYAIACAQMHKYFSDLVLE